MSIILSCNDRNAVIVHAEWVDRWELLSSIRDEMRTDYIQVLYSKDELTPWIMLNVAMSYAEEMEASIKEKRTPNMDNVVGMSGSMKLSCMYGIGTRKDCVLFPHWYEEPSVELYRFFLPSTANLLMKVDRNETVENRMEEYEKIGREIRKRGVPWFYANEQDLTYSFHNNLCVTEDLAIYSNLYPYYNSELTREELLEVQHLNLFMGIAHDAYLCSPDSTHNGKKLVWHHIDWEALHSGCVKYRRTPDKAYKVQKDTFNGQVSSVTRLSQAYDENLLGLYTVLSGGKYTGILPNPSYTSDVLREEERPLELINIIYSGYTFTGSAAKHAVEELGFGSILGFNSRHSDGHFGSTFGWMNYIVLKRCSSKNVVDQVNVLGEHFGTAAISNFKDIFESFLTVSYQYANAGARFQTLDFIEAAENYLTEHSNEMPTKIPIFNNQDN